jgi:Sec-independent protein secretion pathway component TatC
MKMLTPFKENWKYSVLIFLIIFAGLSLQDMLSDKTVLVALVLSLLLSPVIYLGNWFNKILRK